MDTFETYIKMCEKAVEIQEYRKKIFPTIEECSVNWWHITRPRDFETGKLREPVWLPRQDQLQEMAWSHTSGTYNLLPTKLFAFSDYWEENGIPNTFTSMEQLWLAFMMKEKFGKVWNGEDWVITT